MLQVSAMGVSGMQVSGQLLEFYEDGVRFSTLKIDGGVCDAFRACRARAATCGAKQYKQLTSLHQFRTLQMMKSWAGSGNEARVRASGAVRASNARAATCGVEQ